MSNEEIKRLRLATYDDYKCLLDKLESIEVSIIFNDITVALNEINKLTLKVRERLDEDDRNQKNS